MIPFQAALGLCTMIARPGILIPIYTIHAKRSLNAGHERSRPPFQIRYRSTSREYGHNTYQLSIDFSENEVHGSNYGHRIRQHMAPTDLIKAAQMGEAGGADLAPIWPFAAIADDKDAHLALGCFDGAVGFSGGDGVAFGEEEEVVDERFHVLFHRGSGGRGDFVVFHSDGTGRHLVETLMDDSKGLPEFFHAAEVSIVAISVDAHGHVEVHLIVGIVRLAFPHVPGNARATEHDARERVVEGVGRGDDADALGAAFPDAVVCEEFFGFVNAVPELGCPLVNVIEEADREIRVHATGANVGRMETGARHTFVEFLNKAVSKRCGDTAVEELSP